MFHKKRSNNMEVNSYEMKVHLIGSNFLKALTKHFVGAGNRYKSF